MLHKGVFPFVYLKIILQQFHWVPHEFYNYGRGRDDAVSSFPLSNALLFKGSPPPKKVLPIEILNVIFKRKIIAVDKGCVLILK